MGQRDPFSLVVRPTNLSKTNKALLKYTFTGFRRNQTKTRNKKKENNNFAAALKKREFDPSSSSLVVVQISPDFTFFRSVKS